MSPPTAPRADPAPARRRNRAAAGPPIAGQKKFRYGQIKTPETGLSLRARGQFRGGSGNPPPGLHMKRRFGTRRPVSRVLSSTAIHLGRPLPDASRNLPEGRCGNAPMVRSHRPFLFGFAPGGVYPAIPVARDAVRSYRTLSPLPGPETGRFAFCGTFPRLAPAGRYPAPCSRGARTFLPLQVSHSKRQPSGRLVRGGYRPKCV